jgi:tellurite resistance protein
MTVSTLLDAAARAFAMVSMADGRLSPAEEHRFARFAAADARLGPATQADVREAWTAALADVQASPSFGAPLVTIRMETTMAEDRATIMRAAQAALVADGRLEPQENAAIRALAEALKLDPDDF